MANEAYRAVFLRVHPTGKMVLSLTTDSDGKESQYAQLVADELGVPALDVKVVPADTDRFGVGHGFNTSPSDGRARGDRQGHGQDPRQGAAAGGHGARAAPETLTWSNGAWVGGDGSDPTRVKTVEDIALYAHGTGELCRPASRGASTRNRSTATDRLLERGVWSLDLSRSGVARPSAPCRPPRRESRNPHARCAENSRALWANAGGFVQETPPRARLRQKGVDRDLDLVDDLERAEERGVGLHAPVALLDDRDGASAPPSATSRRSERGGLAEQRQVALHARARCRRP